ncbi:dihydroorotase [Alkalimonas collagenimarina]|uniref:Dihydroorotase n=1 Tax=Alkalimonas collagenimarina TaxID=400390 RepID=A0ABT9GZL7_9GAMM|nr:dihydroorotase [Alkalimonas collagenimarina]MDP4536504.1 dihydroorotase [Alkalimonas collagenimarina]
MTAQQWLKRLTHQDADLIIHGAELVTPSGIVRENIAVIDDRIAAIGTEGWSCQYRLDATGLHLLPGVIDTQVHFREPGLTHKEDIALGSKGAVLGGVTGFFEMPNTNPLTLSADCLQAKLDSAAENSYCNYAFYIGGSAANLGQLAELEQLPGCAGIKVFMGSSFGDLLTEQDELLLKILHDGRRRVAIHAEDEARLRERKALTAGKVENHPLWRDAESALLATKRIVALAEQANRPLHILHISTADEMAYLAAFKHRVTVETTPHHLTLVAPDCYQQLGSLAQMNPPVRDQAHQQGLWQGIADGTVDVLGSDHAPHTLDEKSRPYPDSPSGMTGVQTLLPVMLNHVAKGRLSLQRLVDLTSSNPARVFGLVGKGRIAAGYDADFTLVDIKAKRTIDNSWIASKAGWTPYHGDTVTGWPIATIIAGRLVMHSDELLGPPRGKPFVFSDIHNNKEPR